MTQEEYNKLTDDLIKYSEAYYNKDVQLISDRDFDELLVKAQYMEKKHPEWVREDSITLKPGMTVNGDNVKHDKPMGSLENTYSEDELRKFYDDMKAAGARQFIMELKYDGVSFSSKYENGDLKRGVSRGDGEYGKDMTLNMRMIDDLTLSENKTFTGEVRGEIMMLKSEFERLNSTLSDDDKHANPRNLASGTLKLLDIERIKERKLNAFSYWLEGYTGSHVDSLEAMKAAGFNVGPYWVVDTFEEMWEVIQEIEKMKPTLDYEIDGAVVKVNDTELWDKIGRTSKYPKWAKAYKYEPDTAITTVKDIVFQVGGSGKITPVAILEPVLLSGSTVQRVTLNNKNYMKDMDIQIGDRVDIKKAAEIIPFINHVIKEAREGQTRTIVKFPTTCPVCGTKLKKLNQEHQDYFCTNDDCEARVVRKIVKYTTHMEIDGFAEIMVQRLYDAGLLCSVEDLYKLKDHKDEMMKLERMGEKLVTRLLKNIEDKKTQKLEKFLAAISIKNAGKNTSKILTKHFKDLKIIMGATREEFMELDDIGDIVADSIYSHFRVPENRLFIKNVQEVHGLVLEGPVVNDDDKGDLLDLDGKNFCITGALSLKRDDYIELLENMGAKVVSGVSKKTHYLITNATTRTSKFVKAEQLGIPVLTEMELLEMCDALHLLKRLTQ